MILMLVAHWLLMQLGLLVRDKLETLSIAHGRSILDRLDMLLVVESYLTGV